MNIDLTQWKNKKICVATSGGGDSMALLHYLLTHASEQNILLSAVNCEHGIRGESSLADSAFVVDYCARNNIPLYSFSADCKALAKAQKTSLETAARNFRYDCFRNLLESGKADYIAVAHHLGDNAETVLFRMSRGASLTGVSGIHSREQDGFIRPLLSFTKAQIDAYLKENALEYCHDETNDNEEITRNAIRLKVLPELEKVVPSAAEGIVRFAALAGEDDEYLYGLAKELVTCEKGVYGVKFSAVKPLFRRACLLVMKQTGIEKDYTAKHLNDLFNLQSAQSGDRICLPRDVIAIKEYDGIVFYRPKALTVDEVPFECGTILLGGKRITVGACPSPTAKNLRFSLERIPSGAVFRSRRDGDVFTKFGGGTKKLKDYLIDKKIPWRERDELIVLACGGEVLAIVGVEISNKIKLEEGEVPTYLYSEGDK